MNISIFIERFLIFTVFVMAVFPSMSIPFGSRYLPVGLLFAILSFFVLLIRPHLIFNDMLKFKKLFSTKILQYFACWSVLSALFISLYFHISFLKMSLSLFLALIISIFLPLFLSFFLVIHINNRTFVKLYVSVMFVIFFFGVVDFTIYFFKIPFLDILYNSTIINTRLYKIGEVFSSVNYVKSYFFPRVQSVFEEPSHFAWFICINLPIVYSLSNSKYKIYKNNFFNILVKKTFIPLVIADLLLTQSPLNIIFSIVITYGFVIIKTKSTIKKIMYLTFVLLIFLIISAYFIINATPEQKVPYRIYTVLKNLNSFQSLIFFEGSLGTRLVTYGLMFKVFLKNVIFGCGWGNLGIFLYNTIMTSNVVLTEEILVRLSHATDGQIGYCSSIFFRTIAETGFIGISLLFLFFVKLKQYSSYVCNNTYGILKDLFFGINLSILVFIFLCFYDSYLYVPYIFFMFGAVSAIYFKLKTIRNNEVLISRDDSCLK